MKKILLVILSYLLLSCNNAGNPLKLLAGNDTVYVHDTVCLQSIPDGGFTYNLPCKVIGINQEKSGKSILFLWLHGGVYDTKCHDFFKCYTPDGTECYNHWQNSLADDYILHYLQLNGIKAIALFPLCHKAVINHCISWTECYSDVKAIIDDYVSKDLVDSTRIYIAGSSDGGTGTWDYVASHGEVFAAALAMSCSNPQKTLVPVYFFNTSSEHDCSQVVNELNSQGCKIRYKFFPEYKHGGDEVECTDSLLNEFFSNTK